MTWINAKVREPRNNQRVLAYTLIENPNSELPLFQKLNKEHQGLTLSGPSVRKFEKRFVENGTHRPIAFWQPITPLPIAAKKEFQLEIEL